VGFENGMNSSFQWYNSFFSVNFIIMQKTRTEIDVFFIFFGHPSSVELGDENKNISELILIYQFLLKLKGDGLISRGYTLSVITRLFLLRLSCPLDMWAHIGYLTG
jgi:hypothetical protein